MKYFLNIFFLFSSLIAIEYNIKDSQITYYGNHYLHKWQGSSFHINGSLEYDRTSNQYRCSVSIPINTFSSGNDNRDSNMLIYCKAYDFPNVSFESKSIQVDKSSINIEGIIEFAGVKKVIKTKARSINLQDSEFSIEGEFEILLSEFGIERPSLIFVKIEDSVKIKYSIKGVHNE